MAIDSPSWLKSSVIYEVFVRNYGNAGTFNDIYNDIERIKALGADILWFMPFYPIGKVGRKGTHGSPYSIKDYEEISKEYGNRQDFKRLIDKAHDNGIKIMIDIVFNHTSMDSKLVETHPEWFMKDENGKLTRKVEDWIDVYDLDYQNKDLWDYLIKVLDSWVDLGVDAFRCDVAPLVPLEFWKKAREQLNQRKELIWVAETLDPKFIRDLRSKQYNVHSDSEVYQAFDLTYDYDGFYYLRSYFSGEKDLNCYFDHVFLQETIFPKNSIKMRFLENHDNPRIASVLKGKDKIKNWTVLYNFLPGASLVYAGQELMMENLPNLFEKDSIKWNKGDYEFLSFFKKIVNLAKEIKSTCERFSIRELSKGIIMIKWSGDQDEYITILNLEDRYGKVPVDFTLYGTDLITNEIVSIQSYFVISKLPIIIKTR
ncbi:MULTISPECIES: alpha-amylase family glycosyl hydrolase [Petrotoga]|uniref:Maltogenic amylase n=2 Tax=Petrotoga sibirica TaxID=156202 RepID=A0A4R8EWS2_9BACT|nr:MULTISPECIES: alpha-amylase family glycosyl hydrolase [Petrotoga]POZ88059.1 alpha-amylase [Petrotoga sibirica DSM 13575]POZ90150.1 alpha-amylase [Petrotoga sp. SL27]TDX17160.1 maltogenic amylase [Petrotoga sibirica]